MVHLSAERRGRGYSLVELLVVLAILALVTLVAIPWFFKMTQRSALKSAAREIQITLTAARMSAIRHNAPVSVAIASLTPPIRLVIVEPVPPTPTPTIPAPYLNLPAQAVQFKQTPNSAGGIMTFGNDGRLVVPVLGALTPNAVMIVEGPVRATTRNAITINTNARGRVQVVMPADWQ